MKETIKYPSDVGRFCQADFCRCRVFICLNEIARLRKIEFRQDWRKTKNSTTNNDEADMKCKVCQEIDIFALWRVRAKTFLGRIFIRKAIILY
jgi:hypothetical protein